MSNKVLGSLKKGLVFVVSAPAGTGKTTLTQMLVKEFPCCVQSLSFTTRPPREQEENGTHYNFIKREEFEKRIEEGEFLEYAEVWGNYYGTSKKWIEAKQNEGKHVVLVIDTQGAMQIRGHYPAVFIFILPPSLEELRRRLLERRTESDEVIEKRLSWAQKEIEISKNYDYRFVNYDLTEAYQVFRSLFIAEEHKVSHKEK